MRKAVKQNRETLSGIGMLQFNSAPGRFGNTVIRNTVYSLFEIGIPFTVVLVTTPFLLAYMGVEGYGLWNVALALLGLMGVFDLGVGTAVTKYIAEYHEKQDVRAISAIVTMSMGLNAVVATLCATALHQFSPWLSPIFASSEFSAEQMGVVFRLCALGLFPLLFQNICLAIPRGLQDFRTPTVVLVIQNALTLSSALLVTYMHGSVVQVIAVTVVIAWLFSIVSLTLAIGQLRRMGASVVFSMATLRQLFGYTIFMGMTGIGIKIFNLLDRVVVAQVLGFSAAAYYIIATGIANKFTALGSAATQALLPAFSSWNINSDKQAIWKTLMRATYAIALASFCIGGALLIFSRPLLIGWLGAQAGQAALYPMRILVFIYMVKTVAAPSFQAANGLGFPGITALATMTAGLGTIVLIVTFAKDYSLAGAAWANIASWALFGIIVYLYRTLNVNHPGL